MTCARLRSRISKIKSLALHVLALILVVLLHTTPHAMPSQQQGGSTDAHVNENSGAATLRVPIDSPAGTAGFQPVLNIQYSSHSGDGPFGLGWSLHLGEIRRSTRFGIPNYDNSDQFELDGELLVPGDSPGRFHTQTETFWRIEKTGETWTVTFTNGFKAHYGTSQLTRIRRNGDTNPQDDDGPVFRWLLSELEDVNGNRIIVAYDRSIDKGTAYPERITYSFDSSSQPIGELREILFILEDRDDVTVAFPGAVETSLTKRVSEIQSTIGGSPFRRRLLTYDSTGYATQRTRLASTQLFGSDCPASVSNPTEVCSASPSQTFTYTDANAILDSTPADQWPSSTWEIPVKFEDGDDFEQGSDRGVRFGDVNGDGLLDLLRAYDNDGVAIHRVYLNTGSGWEQQSDPQWNTALSAVAFESYKIELGQIVQFTSQFYFAQKDSWWHSEPEPPALGRVADVNGDGLIDLLTAFQVGPYREGNILRNEKLVAEIWLNTGSGWERSDALSDSFPAIFASFSVEHLEVFPPAPGPLCPPIASTRFSVGSCAPSGFHVTHLMNRGTRLVDLNGDRLLDVVSSSTGPYNTVANDLDNINGAWLNTGTSWVSAPSWLPPFPLMARASAVPADTGVRFADLNNDDLPDLVKTAVSVGSISDASSSDFGASGVWLNSGDGWCSPSACTSASKYLPPAGQSFAREFDSGDYDNGELNPPWSGERYHVIPNELTIRDLNGDGFLDLLRLDGTIGAGLRAWLHDPTAPNGSVWTEDERFAPPNQMRMSKVHSEQGLSQPVGRGVRLVDVNRDGVLDLLRSIDSTRQSRIAKAALSDLLASHANGRGGVTQLEHSSAANQQDTQLDALASQDLLDHSEADAGILYWSPLPVVSERVVNPINDPPQAFSYRYSHPRYCPQHRSGLGFRLVEMTSPDASIATAYFYQHHGRAGQDSRREISDPSGKVWRRTSTWEYLDGMLVPGSTSGAFVGRLVASAEQNLYAGATGAVAQRLIGYDDTYGYNFASTVETTRPSSYLTVTRVPIPADEVNWIVGLVASETHESNGIVYSHVALSYAPNRGLLTERREDLRERTSQAPTLAQTTTAWTYDAYGNVIATTNPNGLIEHFCYDGDSSLGPNPCPASSDSSHTYLRGYRDAAGGQFDFLSIPGTRHIRHTTHHNGDETWFLLDSFGRPLAIYAKPVVDESATLLESRSYYDDPNDPLNPVPQPFEERLEHVGDGTTVRHASYFNGFGYVVREVIPRPDGWLGRVFKRDHAGRVIRETFDLSCSDDPHCTGLTGNESAARTISYDALGRPLAVETPAGSEVALYARTLRLQPAGGAIGDEFDSLLIKDPNGNLTRRIFDHDRLVWVDECTNTVAPTTTDLTSISCLNPDITFYTYEPSGEIAKVFDPIASATGDFHSSARQIHYRYDTLGRAISIADPDGGTTLFSYDLKGNLASTTNARLSTTHYHYDSLDRLELVDRPDAEKDVVITYDPSTRKRVAISEDQGYTQSLEYDSFGRIRRQTTSLLGLSFTFDFEHDLLDRPTKISYPTSDLHLSYEYSGNYLNRICQVVADGTGCDDPADVLADIIAGVTYDTRGRREQIHQPPGVMNFSYDSDTYRVDRAWFADHGGDRPLDLSYTYDPNGNITQLLDSHTGVANDGLDASATYEFDNRDRLIRHNLLDPLVWRHFDYDSLGNLIAKGTAVDPQGPQQNQFFDDANRPHAITSRSSGETYDYDDDGNMIRRHDEYLTFDSENRLRCVGTTHASCDLTVFRYDVDGNRLSETDSTGTRVLLNGLFVWDAETNRAEAYVYAFGQQVAVHVEPNAVLRSSWMPSIEAFPISLNRVVAFLGALGVVAFVWLLVVSGTGERVLARPLTSLTSLLLVSAILLLPLDGSASRRRSGDDPFWRWLLSDHLGSSVVALSDTGQISYVRVFDPFGRVVADAGDTADSLQTLYTGKVMEEQTNLYDFNARWYDPEIGRFLSVDPIVQDLSNPQTLNPYSFAGNNPVTNTDPDGLGFFSFLKDFFAVVVGIVLIVVGVALVALGIEAGFLVASYGVNLSAGGLALNAGREAFSAFGPNTSVAVATAGGLTATGGGVRGSEFELAAFGGEAAGTQRADPEIPGPSVEAGVGAAFRILIAGVWRFGKSLVDVARRAYGRAREAAKNARRRQKLTREAEQSIRSLEREIEKTRKKLETYRRNPDASDEKGLLRKATPEMRERIIKGRILKLEREIQKHRNTIEKLRRGEIIPTPKGTGAQ